MLRSAALGAALVALLAGVSHRSLMRTARNGDACRSLALGQEDPAWEAEVSRVMPGLLEVLERFSTARARGKLDDPDPRGLHKRVQHPQDWGCVDDVVVDLDGASGAKGAFKQKGKFKATVRLSKNSFDPDGEPKISSIAIKIHDVLKGKRALPPSLSSENSLDFTMVSVDYLPLAPQPNDLIVLHEALIAGGLPGAIKWMVFNYPAMVPMLLYGIIRGMFITTPFATAHYTVHPYAWGPGAAVKFGLFPCDKDVAMPTKVAAATGKGGGDFVKATSQAFLDRQDVCLRLMVQPQKDSCTESIDDLLTPWHTPWTQLGTVTIPKGSKLYQGEKCERLAMNPWNTEEETKPLGWIARVRKDVYLTQSKWRNERNVVF